MTYPILSNNGREVIGFAATAESARRVLMRNLGDHSVILTRKFGFKIHVWMREGWVSEMNGGPVGWMYSIGK